MKTLSRYILGEFFKPLLFTVLAFIGLYIVAQLVDEMRGFVTHKPAVSLIILYYLYRVPYFLIQILPLSILLSALFSLGQLSRHNELMALQNGGIDFFRIVAPILAVALLLVGVSFFFNEALIPQTNPRAFRIKSVNIEHKADQNFRLRRDRLTRSASGNRIMYMNYLDAVAGTIADVILIELGPKMAVKRRVDAPLAVWQAGRWIFENGVERIFDPAGNMVSFKPFTHLAIPFRETPKDFIREEKNSDQLLGMTMAELQNRIRLLKETGSDPRTEEVNFHLKLAFPFANFILALLGVSLPFIFPAGQRAIIWAAIGFVITILTGFFYIGFIAIGTSFGKNGMIPPALSVWIANIVFGLLGVWMILRARK